MHKVVKYIKWLVILVVTIAVFIAISASIKGIINNWDDDPTRGYKSITETVFNDSANRVYPSPEFSDWSATQESGEPSLTQGQYWQGWSAAESMWFYNTTQGSDLLPYDMFMVLEQADNALPFRSDSNMDKFRYIVQKNSFLNPDALPIGIVKDSYKGHDYVGFTCAGCHTSQINYKDVAMRIDGGPSMADMDSFMAELESALLATKNDSEKNKRFVSALTARDYDTINNSIERDLAVFTLKVSSYNLINRSKTHYGYARLDAFGRIFNRVLENVLTQNNVEEVLIDVLGEESARAIVEKLNGSIVTNQRFTQILEQLLTIIDPSSAEGKRILVKLKGAIFNSPNAPVSYPFLWDIPQHDYVQWNGIVSNAGVGPIGRNTGEVIGVFGTLDWQEKPGSSLSSKLAGQIDNGSHISYQSSVDVTNLRLLEAKLKTLLSPVWPDEVFSDAKINRVAATKGRKVFTRYCQSCHQDIERANPLRKVVAQLDQVATLKTDDKMAVNATSYTGFSGITEYQYVAAPGGTVVIEKKAPVASLLTAVATAVVATPDPDKNFIEGIIDWTYNLVATYFDNPIKASIPRGNHLPATTQQPYASLMAYKGRPLNGIWATAPYLHNGSVPTLYDLLLPKYQKGDPIGAEHEYRPDTFMVGSREFDPVKVGFITSGYSGFEFLTHLPGNSNAGHEYAAGKTAQRTGEVLAALTKQQRLNLLEYLKTL